VWTVRPESAEAPDTDLVEARAFYASGGFTELPPQTDTPNQFQDHWFQKPL